MSEKIILEPIFSYDDLSKDLVLINYSLGYNGNVNILFAEKKYDCIRKGKQDFSPGLGIKRNGVLYRVRNEDNFTIQPRRAQNYRLFIPEENKIFEINNKKINYTHALQVDIDKYCFACKRTHDNFKHILMNNCQIIDCTAHAELALLNAS
jgi:hypothetical protein